MLGKVQLFLNAAGVFSINRRWLVIIAGCIRRNTAGHNMNILVCRKRAVSEGEGLLKNNGVLVTGIGIAAKAKVAQAVGNVFSLILFNWL